MTGEKHIKLKPVKYSFLLVMVEQDTELRKTIRAMG